MSEPKDVNTIIVGNFEVAMQLTQSRTLKITGYRYAHDSAETLNARLDDAQDALDRQFVRADIFNKEAQLASCTDNLVLMADRFKDVLEKKNARDRGDGGRLLTNEKEILNKYDGDVKNINAQIASLQAAIRAGKQKINGHLQA